MYLMLSNLCAKESELSAVGTEECEVPSAHDFCYIRLSERRGPEYDQVPCSPAEINPTAPITHLVDSDYFHSETSASHGNGIEVL